MDELYIENFAKPRTLPSGPSINIASPNKIEVENKVLPIKNDDIILDMLSLLDRLEKEIEKFYTDYSDYNIIFNKIREKLQNKSIKGIVELLDHLEQILDVGLPSIVLNKDFK